MAVNGPMTFEEDYWADPMHKNAPEILSRCAPEVTIELIDLLETVKRPTLKWWTNRIPNPSDVS